MDQQHTLITGYRDLSETEIAAMNRIKEAGARLHALIDDLRASEGVDLRWLAIGQTELQQGLMALTRAVARPTSV